MPVYSNAPAKFAKNERNFLLWTIWGLIVVFCLWLAFILLGKILCKIALDQIAELTNTKITTASVDFNTNGSVYIRRLVISSEQQKKYDDTILKADTVYARFSIGSLLLLRPRLKKIIVKDFVFDAQHDLDKNQWNISVFSIRPPKGAAKKIPFIRLKRGMLQCSEISNGQVKVIAAVPLDAEFTPARRKQHAYSFEITTAERIGRGKSVLKGFWRPGSFKISGGISSADIPALEKAWVINALSAELNYDKNNDYSFKLKIDDSHGRNTFDPNTVVDDTQVFFTKGPFFTLQKFFSRYRPSGTFAFELEAFGSLEKLNESRLIGKVHCRDISICDQKFPYTIDHLVGRIDLTEKRAVLNNLFGTHGDVKLILNGWSEGFGPNRKYQLRITCGNMVLDDDLYEALNHKQKKSWSAFSPSGLAAIDYRLDRQSQDDRKKRLEVKLLGVDAAYERFSYPLKNLTGKILFADDSVNISNLISQVGGRKVAINGRITDYSTSRPIYDILVEADSIPLDSTIAESLSDNRRDFYNGLNMTGLSNAEIKVFTPENDSVPVSFIADILLSNTSLKSEDFPLLISGISAKTVITPDVITIEDFTGRYKQAVVSLTGRIWPGDQNQKPQYCLLLSAEQTELNNELISLMPEKLKRIISELQLEGKLNITANLNETDREDCSDYMITVDCPGNSINFEEFTYPVRDITGRLMITKNTVTLENISGDLVSQEEDEMGVPASITGDTLIKSGTSTVTINGQIVLSDDFFDSDQLELLSGDISLAADNFKIKGKMLTRLQADTYYTSSRKSWIAKSIIADCYGGKMAGNFELKQSAEPAIDYLLQIGFDNVDLKQFLLDTDSDDDSSGNITTGRMSGVLSVSGRIGESLPYLGRCRLQITDMQIGKISPLAKLLYVLQLTEPGDFAFERMIVDSYIQHNKLFLEQFDLSGKAVAFNGSGWIDLQTQEVNLVLFARGRRLTTTEPSILESLTEGLGKAVVRLEVTGTIYDAHVTTKTLPVIEEAVEILGKPRR